VDERLIFCGKQNQSKLVTRSERSNNQIKDCIVKVSHKWLRFDRNISFASHSALVDDTTRSGDWKVVG
jgi:hypothetical protein